MKIIRTIARIAFLLCVVAQLCSCQAKPIKALVVSGQNNHNWQTSHKVLKQILDNSGIFVADTVLTPSASGHCHKT